MNNFNGIGRITKDIEVRTTQSDIKTCQFSIAINRNYKNKNGEYETDFINCSAFRNTAEFIGKYFKKGNLVAITGRIQTRTYENEKKEKKHITEILVENIMLLERKKEDTKIEPLPQNVKTEYSEDSDIKLTDEDIDKTFNNEQMELPF